MTENHDIGSGPESLYTNLINLNNTGGYVVTDPMFVGSTGTTITINTCDVMGCQTGEDLVEYFDGEVIASCVNCRRRIKLARVPGGFNLMRLRAIAAALVSGDTDIALVEFVEASEELKNEKALLREAEALVELIRNMIQNQDDVASSV